MNNRTEYIESSLLAKIFTGEAQMIFVRVSVDDFYDSNHKRFYEICRTHYFAYGSITKSILQDKAKIGNMFDYGTIDSYIASVQDESVDALILELKDFSLKREQEKVLREVAEMTKDVTKTSSDITSKLYNSTRQWSDSLEAKTYTMADVERELESGVIGQRLNIGVPLLDEVYADNGSHKRTTEVCVAYSKTGKTNYACYRTALYLKQGYKGAYFTFEGGREMIYKFMKPHIENSDNLYIVDDCTNLEQTVAKIWELKIVYDIDFIVVDYLQRIPVSGIPFHNELERIVNVSPELTKICHRENLFGLFLAQPTKAPREQKGWEMFPTTDSIYGSSTIEKDAYMISALFRPSTVRGLSYKNTELGLNAVKMYDGTFSAYHTVTLRVLKQREGVVKLTNVNMIHDEKGLYLPTYNIKYPNHGWYSVV